MFCLFFFYSCVCCVLRNTIMVYELCVFTSEVENSFSVCAQRSVVSTWTYFFRGEALRIILVPKSKFCFHLHCGKRKKYLQLSEISMVFFSTNQALGTGNQEAIPLASSLASQCRKHPWDCFLDQYDKMFQGDEAVSGPRSERTVFSFIFVFIIWIFCNKTLWYVI